ncbi:MAG: hypothetical protein QM528_00545 [Phycisphaerales bacterium]|nr:hypothetical protein [Phycisphaerales bacterium]
MACCPEGSCEGFVTLCAMTFWLGCEAVADTLSCKAGNSSFCGGGHDGNGTPCIPVG